MGRCSDSCGPGGSFAVRSARIVLMTAYPDKAIVEPVLNSLPPEWVATPMTADQLEALGIRGPHVVAGAMSGVAPTEVTAMQTMYGKEVVAGITVARREMHPLTGKGEGDWNIDHYVITRTSHPKVPYALHGPYTTHVQVPANAGLPHWPTLDEFKNYVADARIQLE